MIYQNLHNEGKVVQNGKFITLKAYIREETGLKLRSRWGKLWKSAK